MNKKSKKNNNINKLIISYMKSKIKYKNLKKNKINNSINKNTF